MQTKGIILAGGSGTRLYPATSILSKQLQLVYDKPMIYYPLSTLMLAGIKDILIITTNNDISFFQKLLKDGAQFGLNITYKIQESPKGIAEAFILGENFIGDSQVCLILGDNIFYGKLDFLRRAISDNAGGYIFGYEVQNPSEFGVVELSKDGKIISIEEKPKFPKSNFAIPGLYIFDSKVVGFAKNLKPSNRGELEITELQKKYFEANELKCEIMGRGIAWLDTGTPESLIEAGMFIHLIEKRQGRKIACLEEISLEKGFVTIEQYEENIKTLPDCSYKRYCELFLNEFKSNKKN
ncbi:MAG: glucose-1-phosphate thymidylyltransferase RfbA [Candidatus Kapaibacteriota bacterium]